MKSSLVVQQLASDESSTGKLIGDAMTRNLRQPAFEGTHRWIEAAEGDATL